MTTETKAKYTEGPWTCDERGFIRDVAGRIIAQVSRVSNDADENVANGFVLAASTELLEAAQRALDYFGEKGVAHIWMPLQAAIAKALGGPE